MDKVILLSKFMKDITSKIKSGGQWINGKWIDGTIKDVVFKGAIFPLKPNDFKNYPEGFLYHDDRKLITKYDLGKTDEIYINDKKFIIITSQNYEYLADMKFYVIRESKVV